MPWQSCCVTLVLSPSLSGQMNIPLVDIKSKDFRQTQLQETEVFYTAAFVSPQLKHKKSCDQSYSYPM